MNRILLLWSLYPKDTHKTERVNSYCCGLSCHIENYLSRDRDGFSDRIVWDSVNLHRLRFGTLYVPVLPGKMTCTVTVVEE
jgi:hypothetical protein